MTAGPKRSLEELFRGFQKSAFRLETLDRYAVEGEDESFRCYLEGDPLPPPSPDDEEWQQFVRETVARGRTMSRVHAIAGPLTPYLRYEIEWGYVYNQAAGERIQIIHRPELRPIFGDEPLCDFWLFDDAVVATMEYDEQGRFLGADVVTALGMVAWCQRMRDVALRHAVPLSQYLAVVRRQPVLPPTGLFVPERVAS